MKRLMTAVFAVVCVSKPGTCNFVTAGALPTFGIR